MTSEKSNLPESPLTERAVLSQMMRDPAFMRRAMADGLGEDHFLRYRPVFSLLLEMSRGGVPIDDATLAAALQHAGHLDDIGGATVIRDMWCESSEGKAWRQWVRDLNATMAKRIIAEGVELIATGQTPEAQLEALRQTQDLVNQALAGPPRAKTAREAVALALAELEELAKADGIPGIPTGLPELDAITGGMKKGQLWSVLAKTSRGKSVLMSQFACNALKELRKTMVFSAEMMVHEIIFRKVAHRGKIDLQHLMNPGKAGKGWLGQIKTQLQLIADLPLWIDDTPKMTLAHIEREAMRVADANDGLDLVEVDYLQILKAERARGQNREEVVAMLSGGLKQLAKALGCPVLTASQVNKEGGARESEAIAFDSDVMLSIGDDGIKLSKVRNGKRDEVLPYRLNGAIQTFERFNPEEEEAAKAAENERIDREARGNRRGGGRDRQHSNH